MDPVVTVDADRVSVEPGGQASVTVRVRNLSSIVEGFRIDVLGEAAGWARVLPDHLEVLPQGEALATVLFTPPSGVTTRAGQVPFAVRVVSQVDAGASAVAEGDLQVGSVALSQAKITPATSKGRFSARHRVEFSNWGNTPARLRLEATDPDEALGFLVTPDVLDLPLGTTRAARVKVRARKPFFRGTPLRRAFRVVGRPVGAGMLEPAPGPGPQQYGYDPTQPSVDGAFEQKPIVGRGVLPIAVVALVAAGAIGYLSSRPDTVPADESVAPPAPQNFAAEAISHDTIRLHWDPGARVDSYTLLAVDAAASAGDPRPPAISTTEDIPGEQGQFDVTGLAQNSNNCFQLVAVRGDASSARTAPACATTAQLAAPGAPGTPTEVAAEVGDDGQARITWADASGGAANHVVRRGETVVALVDAPLTEAKVDVVPDDRCYTVQAKQGDLVSNPSAPVCLPPGAGGGGGAGGDLGIIAVPTTNYFILEDPGSQGLAQARRDEMRNAGIPTADILLSSEYPALTPPLATATYLVYIPNFASAEAAQAFCTQAQLSCDTYTPGRHQQAAAPAAPTTSG